MKLAADGAFVWFNTTMPLPKSTINLAGYMNFWDVTILARQLHDPFGSKLREIDKAYNAAFRHNSVTYTMKERASVSSTRQEIDDEFNKMAEIILDFTIQQRHETSFLGQSILYLPLITKIEE